MQRLLILLVSYLCAFIPISSYAENTVEAKTTLQILANLAHKQRADFYGEIRGIPPFNISRHSDGCSGGMSASYAKLTFLHQKYGRTLPWRDCCVIHDEAYYYGGEKTAKIAADQALKQCVSKSVGPQKLLEILGRVMEETVLIAGKPYFPTSYRWGYGEDFRYTEHLPSN